MVGGVYVGRAQVRGQCRLEAYVCLRRVLAIYAGKAHKDGSVVAACYKVCFVHNVPVPAYHDRVRYHGAPAVHGEDKPVSAVFYACEQVTPVFVSVRAEPIACIHADLCYIRMRHPAPSWAWARRAA